MSNPLPPGVTSGGGGGTPPPASYIEDFNDNLAQNFSLTGNFAVAAGKLSSLNWSANKRAFYNGQSFSAYTFKIDKLSSGGSVTNLDQILFNYVDTNNYYFVEFTGGASGTATLKKKIAGVVSTLASYGTYATSGQNVTIEVTRTASQITVKSTKAGVQTTLFNAIPDASLPSGKVGVSTIYNNVDYDNVNVQ